MCVGVEFKGRIKILKVVYKRVKTYQQKKCAKSIGDLEGQKNQIFRMGSAGPELFNVYMYCKIPLYVFLEKYEMGAI
jgi:hypothetical protein